MAAAACLPCLWALFLSCSSESRISIKKGAGSLRTRSARERRHRRSELGTLLATIIIANSFLHPIELVYLSE